MNAAPKLLSKGSIVCRRYQIERYLGRGLAGATYTCRDLDEENAERVIKILDPAAFAPETAIDSSREFSLLLRLRHPNLVRILDFGALEDSGSLFLIEEWISGKDLYSATQAMDTRDILSLITELSRTIQYLHARGIVHGNLKPSNVMLLQGGDGIGTLKVLGFGLKSWSKIPAQISRHGTLAYAAPELLLGEKPDARSDMYSFGILIYQLLARRLPFEDEDPDFLIQKHLHGSVELHPIERLDGGAYASQMVGRLLDKNPANRPASGEVVAEFVRSAPGKDRSETDIQEMESCFSASQFVGREKEMMFLQESSDRILKSGRGRTVFVAGEAGSGKTRLMDELKSWALLKGWRVIEGACGEQEEAAYAPYRQILGRAELKDGKAIFRFGEPQTATETGAFDSSSEFAAGRFRDLLTRELVRHLAERPTMLFLHDFHQADEATGTVLDYLSSDIQAHPILMCVSFRSGEVTKGILGRIRDLAIRQERGEKVTLYPLAKESVKQLIFGMTGDKELKETLGSWIFENVGGNPFFVEEMLKHLVEQGVLFLEQGKWEFVVRDLEHLEVPASVGAVLQRRLTQLSQFARMLANWLALFRRPVSRSLLSSVMPQNASGIDRALHELSLRQMAQVEVKGPEETAAVRHALITEVIRGDLPKKVRQRMHRKIAEVIEREYGPEGHLRELSWHHIEGKSKDASAHCVLAAAFKSRAEFAHEHALRCFEHVFRNRNSLASPELCQAAIEACDTMCALGQPKRAIQLIKREMSEHRNIDVNLRARMFMQLALSCQHLGDLHMQEAYCRRGLRLFRNRSDNEANLIKAMLWAELAYSAVLQSKPRRGLNCLDKALGSYSDKNAGALAGRIQILSAILHRVTCNLLEAQTAGEKATAILSRAGESYLTSSAYSTLGGVLVSRGRFPLALEKHRQAVSFSEKSRSIMLRSQALGNLAECLVKMGRIQEALTTAKHAAKLVCESNNPATRYAFNTILAEIRLAASDFRGAYQLIRDLDGEDECNLALFTVGHAHYVAASLNFVLGNFSDALKYIDRLRGIETREAPVYERGLAEALRARILSERGLNQKALGCLRLLENAAAKRHWPYQRCILKLHACEIFLKQEELDQAQRYARDALRLAKGMQSTTLTSHAHLLLGLIHSPLRHSKSPMDSASAAHLANGTDSLIEKAVKELRLCCESSESIHPSDSMWRAHRELCLIFKSLSKWDLCLNHAKKAYQLLCRLEDQVPAELLPAFYGAFRRSHAKLELARLIESESDLGRSKEVAVANIHDDENTRIFLRVSATVNSIQELNPLLEAILDQLIPALNVERALVFLADESTGKLRLAKGRNERRESIFNVEAVGRSILKQVCKEGKPMVSANLREDPRIEKEAVLPGASGKLLCAPLKASGRMMGVLYADHSAPAKTLSESTINLFAAFCNLAAMAIDNTLAHQQVVREKGELEKYLHQVREEYPEIVGKSDSVETLRDRIGLAAASPLDILITGESGTGKELVAKAIHRSGRRKGKKLIPVDCGALSDSLAEAELFGYRRGAFTGAFENRPGLLEAAHEGVIFFDEISNLPFRLQAKLLRVLQEREVRRIGETVPRKIDVQVIAATNRDLLEEIKTGGFRKDLFYRLRQMEIRVPSLRERAEDIPLLIEWFLEREAGKGSGRSKMFTAEALGLLKQYSYPGNIRELKNIVSGSYYSTVSVGIGPDALPPEVRWMDEDEISPEIDDAARIYGEILEGKGSFEDLVKKPFQQRQFNAALVRDIIHRALQDAGGRYRSAFQSLRIPEQRYALTMQFLKRNRCYLDFRPFRSNR